MASRCTLETLRWYTWIYIHLDIRWMISLSWWNCLTAITTSLTSPSSHFPSALSSITDLSVHYSDETENLKMLPLCVSQLKVLREHWVNIHWLASTARNLINMSSGCLLSVSFNALPTQTPTHMSKAQVHTRTNTHDTLTQEAHTCSHARPLAT